MEFAIKHLWGLITVRGRFDTLTGVAHVTADGTITTSLIINAASVDTKQNKRDKHLRSADFFNVETHPQITFKSTRVVPESNDRYKVYGDLSILGVTRQTVCDWRNHNPAFATELNRRRQDLWLSHADRLRRLADKAIKVLELDLMEGQTHLLESKLKIRQAAAVHILRACGLYGDNLLPEPEGETTDP